MEQRGLSPWLRREISEARYLAQLQVAGDIIVAVRVYQGRRTLAHAWTQAWERLRRENRIDDFEQNDYYLKVLNTLQA